MDGFAGKAYGFFLRYIRIRRNHGPTIGLPLDGVGCLH
jgi:hypothetical protein